ncbi:hypothetical protein EYF80_012755 [Liparis tanakae]|uniref:Uncharacterized protein n=1 Tax=Liparis tanakae TaxID=230148 RepID=A0A4Z2IH36_9TELE|nr:hypothetical protein EYF80_012755 [Liparis tanakae]
MQERKAEHQESRLITTRHGGTCGGPTKRRNYLLNIMEHLAAPEPHERMKTKIEQKKSKS